MKREVELNEIKIKYISSKDTRNNGKQKFSCYIPSLLAIVLTVSAIFFVLPTFEVKQDSNPSLSIKNNLAFALEDTTIEKANVDNHNIPAHISLAITNLDTDISNHKSTLSSPAIHSTTYSSHNTVLQDQYQKQYRYQDQDQHQLQPERQQKHQLYQTRTGDYYNNGKNSNIELASTMAATSPPFSSPLPRNPPILNVPGDNYVEATSSAGAQVNYIVTATATLSVSGSSGNTPTDKDVQKQQPERQRQVPLSPVCSPQSGSVFPIGTTTVTCTVIDRYSTGSDSGGGSGTGSISNNGKSVTKSFKIVVRDTTAPSLTLPADSLTIKATGEKTTAISFSTYVSALDIVDGTVTTICSPPSGSLFPIGTTTVSCSAIDRHGNTATGSFGITVLYPVFGGFSEPIDPNGNSVFKLGSTIPIRFQLKWPDGQPVIDAKAQIYNAKISDKIVGGGLDESGSIAQERQGKVEENSPPAGTTASAAPSNVRPPSSGNYFTYDSSSGLYTYNLGSGNLSAGTWQIKIVLDDGSTHTVNISLVN